MVFFIPNVAYVRYLIRDQNQTWCVPAVVAIFRANGFSIWSSLILVDRARVRAINKDELILMVRLIGFSLPHTDIRPFIRCQKTTAPATKRQRDKHNFVRFTTPTDTHYNNKFTLNMGKKPPPYDMNARVSSVRVWTLIKRQEVQTYGCCKNDRGYSIHCNSRKRRIQHYYSIKLYTMYQLF